MSTTLPAVWAQSKTVPTETIKILGISGDVVATLNITGSATVTTAYPYTSRTTAT